jgi:glycosyltransferase involved in cell wall biosynthesis
VIAVSATTKRQVIDRLGVEPERIAVTYEGVGAELQSILPEELPAQHAVRAPYFLYVGNAYPHKNLPRLVEAFARLRDSRLGAFQLVLAGNHGPYGPELEQLVRMLHIEGRVVFPGQVTDGQLAALYRGATALVVVSLAEGFGLPGLEAMALGVPVLASRIDAFTEIYGDAAFYAEPSDCEDIARRLAELGANSGLRDQLRKLGSNRAARFSWRATAEATRQIYLECLDGRKRA